MKTVLPTEYDEQVAFVQWLELKGLKFTAIPNSTFTRSWNQKRRNTASGLRPGLPDMLIILPGVGLAFVELKRIKGGVLSEDQRIWVDELNKLKGIEACVCKGFEAAKAFIEELLK